MDPAKDNSTQPLSIKEILDELKISKDDYYRLCQYQKIKVYSCLERQPNSCFILMLA